HGRPVEQLGQAEVEALLDLLEPIHVEVVELEPPPFVLPGEREGRARDRLGDAEGCAEALGERGLARAEVADEQDEVTWTSELGDGGGELAGLVDRSGRGGDHTGSRYRRCSRDRTHSGLDGR